MKRMGSSGSEPERGGAAPPPAHPDEERWLYDSAIVWLYDAYTPLDNLLLDQSEAYRRVETPGGQRFGLITDQGVTYALIPVSGDLTGDPAHGVTDKTALEMLGTARRAAPRL